MEIDDTGSIEGIYAFIYCRKWRSEQVLPMPYGPTTLKDRATQLLINYKSGALVTQIRFHVAFVQILMALSQIGNTTGNMENTVHSW